MYSIKLKVVKLSKLFCLS